MEGKYADSELVAFGYNRDGKRGHEQIVVSLLCSKDGCPVAVEVLRGNTKDETTVLDKIKERKYTFDYVIEALKNIRKNTVDVCGVESSIVTEPNQEQKRILKLLGVNL